MTQVALDEVMLREPRLLRPGMQPLGNVRVGDRTALGRGLKYYWLLGRPAAPEVSQGTASAVSGAKPLIVAGNPTRGFGATFGTGTSDIVTPASSITLPVAALTHVAKVRRNGAGGGNFGRIWQHSSSIYSYITWENASGRWAYARPGTTFGNWAWAAGTAAGSEYIIVLTMASGDTDPVVYIISGGSVTIPTITRLQAGSGYSEAAGTLSIGNRASDLARVFDGQIEWVGIWDRVLSSGDVLALAADQFQALVPA
jgi:hypothetical protein